MITKPDFSEEYERIPKFLTRKDLLQALREQGLPSTWMQINVYYTQKMLPAPSGDLSFHRGDTQDIAKQYMYIYTEAKILETVEAVRRIKEYEREERKQRAEKK